MLKKIKKMYPHQSLMAIFIIGLLIIAGSFTTQYIFNVQPCEMCYWQRYLAIAMTVVAFIGTLFRGKIKKLFLATITLITLASFSVGLWQSLAQRGFVELPIACQAQEQAALEVSNVQAQAESEALLANLKANKVEYIDCSKVEDFFLNNMTKELMGTENGISLANVNVVLMFFIAIFSFYKLFFKPRKRFRKFNKRHNHNHKHKHKHGNNRNNHNRRYRGSGYNRSNNRNNRRYNNNRNSSENN